ncbi:MAG: type II secretion system secretin GspD [Gammaproteobacteria bacterium]
MRGWKWGGAVALSLFVAVASSVVAKEPVEEIDDQVRLNLVDTDIGAVLRLAARFTGRQFLIDPRVKGQLTLVSDGPVSYDKAYELLLGALRLQGYTVVDVDGVSRVLPQADAKLHGGPVGSAKGPGGEIVTRTFQLNYENAANLVPVLRPMIAPDNPITAYPGNNTLVITDYADNLDRIARVIASIDTPVSLDTEVVKLRHGIAVDVAALAAQLLDSQQGNDPTQRILVVADPRSNSVVVRASSPARTRLARELIGKLDEAQTDPGNLQVVYLRNAQAVHLAGVLRGLLTGQSDAPAAGTDPVREALGANGAISGNSGSGSSSANATNNGNAGNTGSGLRGGTQPSTTASGATPSGTGQTDTAFSAGGVTVQADATTNTLIISAPEPMYRSLRKVIDQLDQRRAQVLVESLIVEVTENDTGRLGIQWLTGNGRTFGGANFGGSGINKNGATTIDVLPEGFNIGVLDGTIRLPGIGEVLNLKVLANALQSRNGANILSTPNLMTLDNEPASIMVGQTVPFVTGRYVTNSGDGSSNPFQTIEREDVGLKLNIRPQISEGGTVKLDIYQEVSSIDQQLSSDSGVVTNKRALDTSVLLDDGQIMVLGGLLQDNVSSGRDAVPGLGRLPLLGGLFRSENRNRVKTNLMIFLRPHVVRDTQAGRSLTLDRYEFMRQVQGRAQPGKHWLLPEMQAPLLPPSGVPVAAAHDLRAQPRATGTSATAAAASGEPAPQVTGDLQALYGADGAMQVVQFASAPDREQADRIARQAQAGGVQAYAAAAPDGRRYWLRTQVARDPARLDATVALLRRMGYQPELVMEP